MTIQSFMELCINHEITDYDRQGFLMSAEVGETNIKADPDEAIEWTKETMPKYPFLYVVWYNK